MPAHNREKVDLLPPTQEHSLIKNCLFKQWSWVSKIPLLKIKSPERFAIDYPSLNSYMPPELPPPELPPPSSLLKSLHRKRAKIPSLAKIAKSLEILEAIPSILTFESLSTEQLDKMYAEHVSWYRARNRLFSKGQVGYHSKPLRESNRFQQDSDFTSKETPTMAEVVLHDSRRVLVKRLRKLARKAKSSEEVAWRREEAENLRVEEGLERMKMVIEDYGKMH
jgi:hypothetical protein